MKIRKIARRANFLLAIPAALALSAAPASAHSAASEPQPPEVQNPSAHKQHNYVVGTRHPRKITWTGRYRIGSADGMWWCPSFKRNDFQGNNRRHALGVRAGKAGGKYYLEPNRGWLMKRVKGPDKIVAQDGWWIRVKARYTRNYATIGCGKKHGITYRIKSVRTLPMK